MFSAHILTAEKLVKNCNLGLLTRCCWFLSFSPRHNGIPRDLFFLPGDTGGIVLSIDSNVCETFFVWLDEKKCCLVFIQASSLLVAAFGSFLSSIFATAEQEPPLHPSVLTLTRVAPRGAPPRLFWRHIIQAYTLSTPGHQPRQICGHRVLTRGA